MTTGLWEDGIRAIIKQKDNYNPILKNASGNLTSTFDVLEIIPNGQRKDLPYLIGGNEASLAQQTSLFLAFNEVVNRRVGGSEFDRWRSEFEYCFPNHGNSFRTDLAKPWGNDIIARPYLQPLPVNPTSKQNRDYLVYRLFPDRTKQDEYYYLAGTESMIMSQAILIMNGVTGKGAGGDDGWLGYPASEYAWLKRNSVELVICLATVPHPPYKNKKGQHVLIKQVTLHDVDPTKLGYKTIRDACGGDKGLVWGDWMARAYTRGKSNHDPLREVEAKGDSEKTATENAARFVPLTRNIYKETWTSHNYSGNTSPSPPVQVYPAWVTIFLPAPDSVKQGNPNQPAPLKTKSVPRIDRQLFIHSSVEPSGWDNQIQNLLNANANTGKSNV